MMLHKIMVMFGTALFWVMLSLGAHGASESGSGTVVRIRLQDVAINPVISQFIRESILEAEGKKVPLVIELDTPGGLLRSTRDIVKDILAARVPVIVYVAPDGARAASAGVFITMAAHVAAMAPATNIGAAHPVGIGGTWPSPPESMEEAMSSSTQATDISKMIRQQQSSDVMSDKLMNDTLAWIQGIAVLRGRNAEWAKRAVEKSESLMAGRALELNVVDMVCSSTEDLLQRADGRVVVLSDGTSVTLHTAGAVVTDRVMNRTQEWMNILADPSLAYLLFLAGVGLVFYELTHFGLIVPGLVGGFCLLLAAFAFQVLPINYFALMVMVLGIFLLVAELKFTSYGVLTIAGILCLWFGAAGLIDTAPGFPGIAKSLITGVTVFVGGVMSLLVFLVLRAMRRRVAVGIESMAGQTAVAMTVLAPHGKVEYEGCYWDAVCSGGVAQPGDRVELERVEGLLLYVKIRSEK